MIIDIWKPLRKGSGKNKHIIGYEMVDIDNTIKMNIKGYIVRYTCDKCKSCNIQTTTTSVLFRKCVYNTLSFQICRSCRSKISENEIKKTQIPFDVILKSIESANYKLLTTVDEYEVSNGRSQMKLDCLCQNNHVYKCTWNNWSKGKRCKKCYNINRYKNSVSSKDGWEMYKFLVWKYTNINYKNHSSIINPLNLKRSKSDYNVDHKFSISEGFKNNIPPKIIGSAHNLEMMGCSKNISKGAKCSIKLDTLFELYFSDF